MTWLGTLMASGSRAWGCDEGNNLPKYCMLVSEIINGCDLKPTCGCVLIPWTTRACLATPGLGREMRVAHGKHSHRRGNEIDTHHKKLCLGVGFCECASQSRRLHLS